MAELNQHFKALSPSPIERVDGSNRRTFSGRAVAETVQHTEKGMLTVDVDGDRLVSA